MLTETELNDKAYAETILTNPPDRFVAYVGSNISGRRHEITTWHGTFLGYADLGRGWKVNSYIGSRMYQADATIAGRSYTGRTFGQSMSIVLRETAASKRKPRIRVDIAPFVAEMAKAQRITQEALAQLPQAGPSDNLTKSESRNV